MRHLRLTTLLATGATLLSAGSADALIFGTQPIPISVTGEGARPNGASGGPAVSGDDRKGRYAGFHSEASDLVGGDLNGVADVFLWQRPRGQAGLELTNGARPAGGFARVSVGPGGIEANGASLNPSIDGSVVHPARCVAFQSQATNLSPADTTPDWDVYVRNVVSEKTVLVSRGVTDAILPSIDGGCDRVAFQAGDRVYVGRVGRGVRSLGPGADPDFSLDGTAIAFERGANVVLVRKGKPVVAGPGSNPRVSDAERLAGEKQPKWGVVFDTTASLTGTDDNPGSDVYMRVFGPTGGVKDTDLISATVRGGRSLGGNSYNGGITAYAPNRGILTWVTTRDGKSDLYYRNNNTGNIDDLAHAPSFDGAPAIYDVVTSARANFVAFSTRHAGTFDTRRDPTPIHAMLGAQSVFFKHLIDGEPV